MSKQAANETARLVVRIDLVGARPPNYRRFHFRPALTLDLVHEAIQITFDWDDSHLHEFKVGTRGSKGGVRRFGMSHDSGFVGDLWDDATPEHTVSIGQLLKKKGDKVQYSYDFGDNWQHSLKLEGIVDVEPDTIRVACVDGRRAAPPEDSGWAEGWAVGSGGLDLAAIQACLERMFGQADR